MTLGEYINQRVSSGESYVGIGGIHNDVDCDLIQASRTLPAQDWDAEIILKQAVPPYDGRAFWFWIHHSDGPPDYVIMKTDHPIQRERGIA